MALKVCRYNWFLAVTGVMVLILLSSWTALGSDHGDTSLLAEVGREDANITDLYAFLRSDNLVLLLCTNPTIPNGVSEYLFPSDLKLRIFIDNNSEVRFDNHDNLMKFGGTIVHPELINEDIVFEITFDKQNSPQLILKGLPSEVRGQISLFSGLRDDPFIRGPRIGRNVAAVAIELPLLYVRCIYLKV